MSITTAIPNFRLRRQHGQCPACDHSGSNCHCHKRPKRAALIFVKRQIELAQKSIATARETVQKYQLKDSQIPNLHPSEIGSIYVDPKDRFIVSLVVGYGPDDGVSSPEEAVGATLGFITTDEHAPGTQWHCFDRETGILHVVQQNAAQV